MANNLHKFLYSFEKTIRSYLILKHTKFQIHIFENGCVTGGGGGLSDKKWMLSNGECLYGLSQESIPRVKLKLFMITVTVH